MAVKSLDAYKLGIILDASQSAKGISTLKEADALANKTQQSFLKLGKGVRFNLADQLKSELKEVDKIAGSSKAGGVKMGESAGAGFKDGFVSTVSSLLGTAILPGVGTAAGAVIGSALNTVVSKLTGPVMDLIQNGISLNEQLELAKVHVTSLTGSEEIAGRHLEALKKLSAGGFDLSMLLQADQRLEEFNKDLRVSEVELRAAAVASTVFGSGAAGFDSIADSLGLIAEKGELTSKTLTKLQKQGINVSGYLAKAFGISEKRVNALIKANRIKGDIAAQIISEELILDKGARADAIMQGTGIGARARYDSRMALLGQQATQNVTLGVRDYYNRASDVIGGPGAQAVVNFIDQTAGMVIAKIEAAVNTGVNAAKDVAGTTQNQGAVAGVASFENKLVGLQQSIIVNGLKAVGLDGAAGFADGFFEGEKRVIQAAGDMGQKASDSTRTTLDSHSPSRKYAEIGADAAEGFVVGFEEFMAGRGVRRLTASVNGVTARARAEALLQNPRVRAFLDVIKRSELGAGERDPYGRAFGPLGHRDPGTLSADGTNWPGMSVYSPTLHRTVQTHAFGAYQFEPGTYRGLARMLGLTDVLPHSQDLAAVADLAQHPSALNAILSGNARGAMSLLGGEWESFAVNGPGKTASLDKLFNSLSVGGVAVSASNPVPVQVTGDITGGTGTFVNPLAGGAGSAASKLLGFQSSYAKSLNDLTKPLGDVVAEQQQLPPVVGAGALSVGQFIATTKIVPPALAAANEGFLVLTKSADELQKMGTKAAVGLDGVLGALEQAAGLLPSGGQVGKKRGFFSKLLGIAAPFLSFIPGVGPIVSEIAKLGSDALAGNWQGVATGIAGGFSSGGIFRGTPSTSSPSNGLSSLPILNNLFHYPGSTATQLPQRATGGPVRKGRAYVVGEHRPEVFTPDSDGWIHPSMQSYTRGAAGGAHGGNPMVERLIVAVEALHAKVDSMPAGNVVMRAADTHPQAFTKGFMSHASSDPRVIEWMSRRVAGI